MAEWSRRQTRNLVGSALVGSNPADVVLAFCLAMSMQKFFGFGAVPIYLALHVTKYGLLCLLGEMDTAFPP